MSRIPAWGAGLVLAFSLFSSLGVAAEPEDLAIKRAAERGRLILELDQAAWVSTDEMFKRFPNPSTTGIRGWIVEVLPDRLRTTYAREKYGKAFAAFIADSRGRTVVSDRIPETPEDEGLSPLQARMVEARDIASKQPVQRCTDGPMNSVVIPPTSADHPVEVYELSAQVKTDEYPLGGHYLFAIGTNGQVMSQRKFMTGCMNLQRPSSPGSKPAGIIVTHLLDLTPTEIHVFSSLTANTPIFVVTSTSLIEKSKDFKVWSVVGDKIALADVGPR